MANEVCETVYTKTPNGNPVKFRARVTTNDSALVAGIIGEDEYDLRGETISGWVLDIGAHIGLVAVTIAVDFMNTKVVAVEAIPDNARLIQDNVDINGLTQRVFVESAGAAGPGVKTIPITYGYTSVGIEGGTHARIEEGYVRDCRYIGNIFEYPEGEQQAITEQVPALSLSAIIAKYDIDRVGLLKIDCEGCEYAFLKSKAVAKVDRIIGEHHKGIEDIHRLLDSTHVVTSRIDRGGVGIFSATRR